MVQRLALALLAVAALACSREAAAPRVVLWAWERPEDLRFAGATEVAYLAGSIDVHGERVLARPRMQPLRVAEGSTLVPVIRIEARDPGMKVVDTVAKQIVRLARHGGYRTIQVDFDATAAQRAWYAALLRSLRKQTPPGTAISITALASWCLDDRWLDGLPIDEAVPMLFRMGPESASIRARLASAEQFREPLCRASAGFSTDEPFAPVPGARRIYVFNPRPWDQSTFNTTVESVERNR